MYRTCAIALGFALLTVSALPLHPVFARTISTSTLETQCILECFYNGGGEYVFAVGKLETQGMDQELYGSLPSPQVQTICDKLRMGTVQRWLPQAVLLLQVACYGYKGYAWYQWLQVRWGIHEAAVNHGCAIYILSAATSLRGERVHLASTWFGGTLWYLRDGSPTYVAAKTDRYMAYNHHTVTCRVGVPLVYPAR